MSQDDVEQAAGLCLPNPMSPTQASAKSQQIQTTLLKRSFARDEEITWRQTPQTILGLCQSY